MYARWYPGQAPAEERDGYWIRRAPFDWRLAVPGLRRASSARGHGGDVALDTRAGGDRERAPDGPQEVAAGPGGDGRGAG